MRQRGQRQWGTIPEDMLHFLGIVQSSNEINVVLSGGSLPQHDTSKRIGVQVHVCLDQWLDLLRGEVESFSCSILSGWKTDEKLCFRILGVLDDIDPIIKVEVASVVHKVPRRTALRVVELDPDEVERSVLDGIVELLVREDTLRGGGDVEFLVGVLLEAVTELVDHGSVS